MATKKQLAARAKFTARFGGKKGGSKKSKSMPAFLKKKLGRKRGG